MSEFIRTRRPPIIGKEYLMTPINLQWDHKEYRAILKRNEDDVLYFHLNGVRDHKSYDSADQSWKPFSYLNYSFSTNRYYLYDRDLKKSGFTKFLKDKGL